MRRITEMSASWRLHVVPCMVACFQVELTCEKCGCESARVSHQLDVLPRLSAYLAVHHSPAAFTRAHAHAYAAAAAHVHACARWQRRVSIPPRSDHGHTTLQMDVGSPALADVSMLRIAAGSSCCISSGSRSTRRSVRTRSRMRMCARRRHGACYAEGSCCATTACVPQLRQRVRVVCRMLLACGSVRTWATPYGMYVCLYVCMSHVAFHAGVAMRKRTHNVLCCVEYPL